MDLHGKLLHLFPDYRDGDWELVDTSDGRGPRIAKWNRAESQPTQGDINRVTPAQRAQAAKDDEFRRLVSPSGVRHRVLVDWIAAKHGLTYAEAVAEMRVIFDAQ